MQRITKDGLIKMVSEETNCPKSIVRKIVDSVIHNITIVLSQGMEIQFAGFGTFKPKHCSARTGRNPHTSEAVHIPARIVPFFKAGKNLKTAVANKGEKQ